MKTKILFLGLLLSILTISCSKDKDDSATITADDAITSAKLDAENDDVSNIVEDQFDATSNNLTTGKSIAATSAYLPTCATIVRTPAFGTLITPGTTVTKTITFTPGCTMPNGNTVSGSIVMSFVYQPLTATSSQTINISFVNFQHNNFAITGSKILTRTLTAPSATALPHPIVSVSLNVVATNVTNGNVYTRTGTRTREFVEGFYTPTFWDNIFKITGNWTTTHPNGNVQTANITSPVFVKFSCANPNNYPNTPRPSIMSQGIIEFVRGTHTATLDFGNGSCDNAAVFTLDGVARTITIN
jgi:hypothetical protein